MMVQLRLSLILIRVDILKRMLLGKWMLFLCILFVENTWCKPVKKFRTVQQTSHVKVQNFGALSKMIPRCQRVVLPRTVLCVCCHMPDFPDRQDVQLMYMYARIRASVLTMLLGNLRYTIFLWGMDSKHDFWDFIC